MIRKYWGHLLFQHPFWSQMDLPIYIFKENHEK